MDMTNFVRKLKSRMNTVCTVNDTNAQENIEIPILSCLIDEAFLLDFIIFDFKT